MARTNNSNSSTKKNKNNKSSLTKKKAAFGNKSKAKSVKHGKPHNKFTKSKGPTFTESLFGPVFNRKRPRNATYPTPTQDRRHRNLQRREQVHTKRHTRPNYGSQSNNATRKFRLKLPKVSSNDDDSACWTKLGVGKSNKERKQFTKRLKASQTKNKDSDTTTTKLLLESISISSNSLQQFHLELQQFAQFVTLTEQETDARHYVLDQVLEVAEHCLDCQRLQAQVFGSFAAPQVCTFESDVDVALWGVVESTEDKKKNEPDAEAEFRRNKRQTRSTTPPPPHPNAVKQGKVQKWKQAFDEVDAEEEAKEKEADTWEELEDTDDENDLRTIEKIGTALQASDRASAAAKTSTPIDNNKNNDSSNLFVIDRVGASAAAEEDGSTRDTPIFVDEDENASSSPTGKDAQHPIVIDGLPPKDNASKAALERIRGGGGESSSDDSESSGSSSSDDDADPLDRKKRPSGQASSKQAAATATTTTRSTRAYSMDSRTSTASSVLDDQGRARAFSFPDAEEMMGSRIQKNQAEDNHQVAARYASTCVEIDDYDDDGDSSDSDIDDEEYKAVFASFDQDDDDYSGDSDYGNDNTNDGKGKMEVSFFHGATPTNPLASRRSSTQLGPTGETRVQVVRALNTLSRRLRKQSWSTQVTVRKHAKVPIVNLLTTFAFELDLCVGGHNGTDTSSYARCYIEQYGACFSTTVLVLKILLAQHDLDKPFTGGLGSFKLYVLVANHIERHVALGGSVDSPAEILLSFLFRYGNIKGTASKDIHPHHTTTLSQFMILQTKHGSADMGGVYQIDNCVTVFGACYELLMERMMKKGKSSTASSLLQYVIDAKQLETKRREVLVKASLVQRYKQTGRIPNGSNRRWSTISPHGKQPPSTSFKNGSKASPSRKSLEAAKQRASDKIAAAKEQQELQREALDLVIQNDDFSEAEMIRIQRGEIKDPVKYLRQRDGSSTNTSSTTKAPNKKRNLDAIPPLPISKSNKKQRRSSKKKKKQKAKQGTVVSR